MTYLLALAVSLALCLAGCSLYRYGDIPRQHILVTFSVLTAWCFSFLIVFTIPLDVTSTLYRQCKQEAEVVAFNVSNAVNIGNYTHASKWNREENLVDECVPPWGMIPKTIFPSLWRIIYWSSQFLTWLLMPMMQSYLKAGDFTFKGKMRSALIQNAIYYGSYLFICAILLIYLAAKGVSLDWPKLKAIASSASNTWGLFLLILLLGYALVEVPRSLWNNAKPGFTLQHAYFKTAKLSTEKAEAEENVEEVLEWLHSVDHLVPPHHEMRDYVDTIMAKVPIELREHTARNYSRSGSNLRENSLSQIPNEKTLIRMHRQIIKSLQTLQRTEALWNVQVDTVFHLEIIAANMHSKEKRFKDDSLLMVKRSGFILFRYLPWLYSSRLHWYWLCVIRAPLLKLLSILTAVMSITVVWSELTFFQRRPVLSLFANVIILAKNDNDFLTIELFSMLVLCYLFYCTYTTILRIKFLNLYYLAPHHQTNEHSLIFSGMLLCRLTPPMCLNFLGLVHMDSHIIKERIMETYYTQIMGHMDVIGIIANGFNIYFPMCMLAFCLATWFSLGSRTLNFLGFQQFMHNETIVTELVQEGKDLIARERRKRQRAEEALLKRRNNNNRSSFEQMSKNRYYRNLPPSSMINNNASIVHDSSSTPQPPPPPPPMTTTFYGGHNMASDDYLLRHGDNLHYSTLNDRGKWPEISDSDDVVLQFPAPYTTNPRRNNPVLQDYRELDTDSMNSFSIDFPDSSTHTNRIDEQPPRDLFNDV